MDKLDVFRVKTDGSLLWIGSADSVGAARGMLKPFADNPAETFLIHDHHENLTIRLRPFDVEDAQR